MKEDELLAKGVQDVYVEEDVLEQHKEEGKKKKFRKALKDSGF